jgi:hypothetical protein
MRVFDRLGHHLAEGVRARLASQSREHIQSILPLCQLAKRAGKVLDELKFLLDNDLQRAGEYFATFPRLWE